MTVIAAEELAQYSTVGSMATKPGSVTAVAVYVLLVLYRACDVLALGK